MENFFFVKILFYLLQLDSKNTEKKVEFRSKESLISAKNIPNSKVEQITTNSINEPKPDYKEIKTEQMHNEASKKSLFRKKDDSNANKNFNQNQEEILEEFKNSLNELIKASKWTRESKIGNCDSQMVTLNGTSLNVEENKHNESLTMRKSTTLSDHHAFNVLNFKNQTFSIDKSKSSEILKLSSNLPSDLNSSLYIQTPQVSKQTDSIGNSRQNYFYLSLHIELKKSKNEFQIILFCSSLNFEFKFHEFLLFIFFIVN